MASLEGLDHGVWLLGGLSHGDLDHGVWLLLGIWIMGYGFSFWSWVWGRGFVWELRGGVEILYGVYRLTLKFD